MNKKYLSIVILVLLVVVPFFVDHAYINYIEEKNIPIFLDESAKEKIIFYRDDCNDCQTVMPYLVRHNFLYHDLIFVNMNNKQNRQYIKKYKLSSVPTIVYGKKRYNGVNLNNIRKVVKSKGVVF